METVTEHIGFKTGFPCFYFLPTEKMCIRDSGNGKTEVSQNKQNETKVQSDYLLTYQNSFADGTHNLTATAGFTTYYNSLSGLDASRGQGIGLMLT